MELHPLIQSLPGINASFNATAATLLVIGAVLAKRQAYAPHRWVMLSALLSSAFFLAGYLTYHAFAGSTPYQGTGIWRTIYFAILIPHSILAAVMLPMIFLTFRHAFADRRQQHRRLARWTLPIWLYVSVTGVIIYFMLY